MTLTFRAAQRSDALPALPLRRFANPDVVCEGWYAVGRSARIRVGDVTRAWIGKRDVVLYRDRSGVLRAVDRACAHLGADLSHATVVLKGLQCAFHRWCWGADGTCVAGGGVASGATLGTYEVCERWGLAWVWVGGRHSRYELPHPQVENRAHVVRLPAQTLACHPHVVLGNGLDLTHVVPVHRFHFEEDPAIEPEPPHRLSVRVHVRFDPTLLRSVLGLSRRTARWRFTNIGPSLAWVRVTAPTPFELLWAARPLPGGGCATQTLFFLPRLGAIARAVPMMIATTWADRGVLQGLDFRPGFVASDAVFARYAALVEATPEW